MADDYSAQDTPDTSFTTISQLIAALAQSKPAQMAPKAPGAPIPQNTLNGKPLPQSAPQGALPGGQDPAVGPYGPMQTLPPGGPGNNPQPGTNAPAPQPQNPAGGQQGPSISSMQQPPSDPNMLRNYMMQNPGMSLNRFNSAVSAMNTAGMFPNSRANKTPEEIAMEQLMRGGMSAEDAYKTVQGLKYNPGIASKEKIAAENIDAKGSNTDKNIASRGALADKRDALMEDLQSNKIGYDEFAAGMKALEQEKLQAQKAADTSALKDKEIAAGEYTKAAGSDPAKMQFANDIKPKEQGGGGMTQEAALAKYEDAVKGISSAKSEGHDEGKTKANLPVLKKEGAAVLDLYKRALVAAGAAPGGFSGNKMADWANAANIDTKGTRARATLATDIKNLLLATIRTLKGTGRVMQTEIQSILGAMPKEGDSNAVMKSKLEEGMSTYKSAMTSNGFDLDNPGAGSSQDKQGEVPPAVGEVRFLGFE